MPFAQAAQRAVEQSKLTLPGSAPFHLKAQIADAADAKSDFSAEVEEYWISPEKWKRSIRAPGFAQVRIVNGDKVVEQNTGDYYPLWLRGLVTAMVDPLPMLEQVKRFPGQVELPADSLKSISCLNAQSRSGIPPVQAMLQWSFCFQGKNGLLQAVTTPGYHAEFSDFRLFKGKRVPWRVAIHPRSGKTVIGRITELTPLAAADERLFAVDDLPCSGGINSAATCPDQQLKSVQVGEDTARRIAVNAPDIKWPTVRSGKASGYLTVYISADRQGRVREVWPLNSDNPAMSDAAREQLLRWQFQPYVNGIPMQMESVLTFAFTARQD